MSDEPIDPTQIPAPGEQLFLMRPKHGWVCFFCGEVFMTIGAAEDHFGGEQLAEPACRIKVGEERGLVMALRKAEEELARYREEDSDKDRQMAALGVKMTEELFRAEESGYARAIADLKAGKAEPELYRQILAAAPTGKLEEVVDGDR